MIENIKEEINKIHADFGKKLANLDLEHKTKRENAKNDRDNRINDVKAELQEALSLIDNVDKRETVELKHQSEPRPRNTGSAIR